MEDRSTKHRHHKSSTDRSNGAASLSNISSKTALDVLRSGGGSANSQATPSSYRSGSQFMFSPNLESEDSKRTLNNISSSHLSRHKKVMGRSRSRSKSPSRRRHKSKHSHKHRSKSREKRSNSKYTDKPREKSSKSR